MSTRLDNTLGAFFVGTVVAAVLYGISCVQALYYYIDQNDPWHFKLMVTTVMIFDTVHQALISHTVYTYTITDWGDPSQVGLVVWSFVAEIIFNAVTAFIVQSFLTMRIWRLSGRNVYITGIIMMLVIGAFVTLMIDLAKMTQIKYLIEMGKLQGLFVAVNTLHAAADLLIWATLCTLLHKSRTGFHRSEIIINKLIFFTVNTGLLTSLCALIGLIALVTGNTSITIAFFFCFGRLYTNTLLASLNSRKSIQGAAANSIELNSGNTPISLGDLSASGSNHHQKISINVKTTTQKHHENQKIDKENSALPYDEESNKVLY